MYRLIKNNGYARRGEFETVHGTVQTPAFMNVNDGTNEGLSYAGKNIFTVQFHPEHFPGPQDTSFLFDRFINLMGINR